MSRAVSTYNNTQTPSLNNLSPIQANEPDNIAFLQKFYLQKKKKHAGLFKKTPKFKVGQAVKIVVKDKFRQRGFRPRWSKEIYKISKILDNALPIGYYVDGFGSKLFYEQELNPILSEPQLSSSLTAKKILAIIMDKMVATSYLRSGKGNHFERLFLVRTNMSDKNEFMSEREILEYDNGSEKLREYQQRKT